MLDGVKSHRGGTCFLKLEEVYMSFRKTSREVSVIFSSNKGKTSNKSRRKKKVNCTAMPYNFCI